MSWAELRALLQQRYQVRDGEGGGVRLVWEYDDGSRQTVVVTPVERHDTEWCDFRSYCCAEDDLPPRTALHRAAGMYPGSLVLYDGDYYCRHVVPLATLGPSDVELYLRRIAYEAEGLQREIGATDP